MVAPNCSSDLSNVWFTDALSKLEGKAWKYHAVALSVDKKEEIIMEGEDSAQVGELVAVWSVFDQYKAEKDPVYIYTDSFAVFKWCTEWLSFWELNNWEVDRVLL